MKNDIRCFPRCRIKTILKLFWTINFRIEDNLSDILTLFSVSLFKNNFLIDTFRWQLNQCTPPIQKAFVMIQLWNKSYPIVSISVRFCLSDTYYVYLFIFSVLVGCVKDVVNRETNDYLLRFTSENNFSSMNNMVSREKEKNG
jgi:hypothetical protein